MEGTLDLGEHFARFVEEQVRSGRYGSASEVVREGLAMLQQSIEEQSTTPQGSDAYDRWFPAEVEHALREADRPDAVWVPHDEVVAEMDREIAEIEAELARGAAASR